MINNKQKDRLRELATRWMEYANLPIMDERRRQWRLIKDLKAEKPMILVETCMLSDYIGEDELINTDPFLRNIEKSMFEQIRHADEIGDDIILEPYFQIAWNVSESEYGVSIDAHHATTSTGNDLGYSFDFAIQSEDDFDKLKFRERTVDRERTQRNKELLEEIFGDILPVRIGGFDWFDPEEGYNPWLGNIYSGLTMDLFKMVGNGNLFMWVYDKPEFIHKLMRFITDDRIARYEWMEKEGLLYVNTNTYNPCPGSYGFVSDLPDKIENVTRKDCWVWTDSQESASISPDMFNEYFLPYMKEICEPFGLAYYACCEAIHDRLQHVEKAIPNLRAVSVSGWNDFYKAGEMIGDKYVYSRKPTPAFISGAYPDWDLMKKDAQDTINSAKNCNLEFCFRDIYTINGDRARLAEWTKMVRKMIDN
jgi:hypothetical protein